MIIKENNFYYNEDINELFIIGKDERDVNDKINKFYYRKLLERNLDYYSLYDDVCYNGDVVFDLMDNDKIFFSDIFNGTGKYILEVYDELLFLEVENVESIYNLNILIIKNNNVY